LPKLNGLDAVRLLKADPATAGIPVVAVTALAMKGDRERILESGCNGYVSKPIKIDDILAVIRDILMPAPNNSTSEAVP
jgi:two-component system cell cycle response regulator DivK